jgi:hypothetical protein
MRHKSQHWSSEDALHRFQHQLTERKDYSSSSSLLLQLPHLFRFGHDKASKTEGQTYH